MKRVLAAAAAMLLLGAAPPPEPISLSISAWGQRVAEWQIEPDGAIASTVMDPATPGATPSYTLVTRQTPAMAGRYDAIVATLKPVRHYAGRTLPCKNPITDADSGAVRWSKATVFTYYSGCTEARSRAVIKRIYAANQQITLWTKDAPITGTRIVGPGQ